MTRDNKIEAARSVVGLTIWFTATSIDLYAFIVLNVLLTLIANTIVPTKAVSLWIDECDKRLIKGSAISIAVITTGVTAAAFWYLLNWLF